MNITAPIQPLVLSVNTKGAKDILFADLKTQENVENTQIQGGGANKLILTSTTGKIKLYNTEN